MSQATLNFFENLQDHLSYMDEPQLLYNCFNEYKSIALDLYYEGNDLGEYFFGSFYQFLKYQSRNSYTHYQRLQDLESMYYNLTFKNFFVEWGLMENINDEISHSKEMIVLEMYFRNP